MSDLSCPRCGHEIPGFRRYEASQAPADAFWRSPILIGPAMRELPPGRYEKFTSEWLPLEEDPA